jgi:hypothetical protein
MTYGFYDEEPDDNSINQAYSIIKDLNCFMIRNPSKTTEDNILVFSFQRKPIGWKSRVIPYDVHRRMMNNERKSKSVIKVENKIEELKVELEILKTKKEEKYDEKLIVNPDDVYSDTQALYSVISHDLKIHNKLDIEPVSEEAMNDYTESNIDFLISENEDLLYEINQLKKDVINKQENIDIILSEHRALLAEIEEVDGHLKKFELVEPPGIVISEQELASLKTKSKETNTLKESDLKIKQLKEKFKEDLLRVVMKFKEARAIDLDKGKVSDQLPVEQLRAILYFTYVVFQSLIIDCR